MSGLPRSSLNSGLSSMRLTNSNKAWVKRLEDYTVTDEVLRDVAVYLCREPLVKAGWETMTHWALFFYFKDSDIYIVYEAGEINGKLTPSRSVCQSLPQSGERGMSFDQVGTLTISQAELHRAALANVLSNEPYCVEKNNCQNWTLILGNILGISKELEEISTFVSTIKIADKVATGFLGVCAVAAIGCWAFSGRSSKEKDEKI